MFPPLLPQDALPHAHRICIDDLKGTMAIGSHEPLRYRERMMGGGRFAEVKAHEGDDRRAVGQYLHITGNKSEMPGVPGTGRLVVGHFNNDMTELEYLRRSDRRALCGVDSRLLLRQVPG
ncbi:hypothetical protein D3C75_465090 [compost metagenome]